MNIHFPEYVHRSDLANSANPSKTEMPPELEPLIDKMEEIHDKMVRIDKP